MFISFFLTTSLLATSLLADTIGNVEYILPDSKKHWKLAAEKKSDKTVVSTTRYYVPENRSSVALAEEGFSANLNNIPGEPKEDENAVKARIQKMFPQTDIEVHVITKEPDAILYTWAVPSTTKPIWGVSKHFHIENGSINLMYRTTNQDIFNADKNDWIEALKAAHIIKQQP